MITIHRRAVLRGIAVGAAGAFASGGLARTAWADPSGSTATSKTTINAADGAQWAIDGINIFRGAGVMVQFTPDYGFSTFTNQWGAEVALVPTGKPNQYTVSAVASATIDASASGNMAIPDGGIVLSAGPADAGQPDPVAYLTGHFLVGDLVTLTRPVSVDSTYTVSATDPTAASNPPGAPYPSFRGPDQLVVYTPAFGSSTGTNQWGVEVTVRNGGITLVYPGGDSAIPADGYVLSGNGLAATWLQTYSQVGAQVTLNGGSAGIHSDAGTAIADASSQVDAAAAAVQDSHDQFVNAPVDQAAASLTTARQWLSKAGAAKDSSPQDAFYFCDQAVSAAYDAYYQSIPTRAADVRGVWYQASETTTDEIRRTVSRMKQTGVNELYLETFYNGTTIYPSKIAPTYGLPAQMPSFVGLDPLRLWAAETARQGIALHAWITGLAVGDELGDGPGAIMAAHPEWAAVGRDHVGESQPAPSSNGFYWLDASDQQARRYFIDVCVEMVDTYGLAGLDLDYMRYADDGDWQHSFNFSDDARAAFQRQTGVDPMTLSPDADAQQWADWTTFTDAEQTRLVVDIFHAVKSRRPAVVVSDAPEAGSEADKVGQWSAGLDVVIPQAYTTDTSAIHDQVRQQGGQLTGGQLIYTGTSGMYSRNGSHATVDQVVAARDLDAGSVVFSFGQAGWAHVHALSIGPWRAEAVQPALHPVAAVRALLDESINEIAHRYVPRGGLDRTDASPLTAQLNAVKHQLAASVNDHQIDAAGKSLETVISNLAGDVDHHRVEPAVGTVLTEQLTYCLRILAYATARHMR